MAKIKKGDKVVVIAGADRADEPHEVLDVDADGGRVTIEGVNMRWKHVRRSQQNPQGGRTEREYPVDISNVMLWSDKAKKGVRVRIEIVDGKKVRVGVPCGTKFD